MADDLQNFKWMTLKMHLLPCLMQQVDIFAEAYISKQLLYLGRFHKPCQNENGAKAA